MRSEWQYHSTYRGVRVDYRPDMQRRGFRIHVGKALGSYRDGSVQVFNTLHACHTNIDKRIKQHGEVMA